MRIKYISENKFKAAQIGKVVETRYGCSGCETRVTKIDDIRVAIQFLSYKDIEIVDQAKYIIGGGSAFKKIMKKIDPDIISWRPGFGLCLEAAGGYFWIRVRSDDWVAKQSLEGGYLPPKVWRGWDDVGMIEPVIRRIEYNGDYDNADWDETHYHVEAEYRPWFAVDSAGNEIEGSSPKELEALPKGLYRLCFYGTDNQGQYRWCGLGITGRREYRYWSKK